MANNNRTAYTASFMDGWVWAGVINSLWATTLSEKDIDLKRSRRRVWI